MQTLHRYLWPRESFWLAQVISTYKLESHIQFASDYLRILEPIAASKSPIISPKQLIALAREYFNAFKIIFTMQNRCINYELNTQEARLKEIAHLHHHCYILNKGFSAVTDKPIQKFLLTL